MRKFSQMVALYVLLAPVLSGCDTSRQTGEAGSVVFEYRTGLDPLDFNKPLALGSRLEVYASTVGESPRPMVLHAALAEPATVLRASTPHEAEVALEAVHVGSAHLRVFGTDAIRGEVTDQVRFRVSRISRLRFGRQTSPPPEALAAWVPLGLGGVVNRALDEEGDDEVTFEFDPGDIVRIPWARFSANGESLIGHGVYPVSFDPPGAAEIDEDLTDDAYLGLRLPDDEVTFRIRPEFGVMGNTARVEVTESKLLSSLTTPAARAWRTAVQGW